jgi:sulfoxide reductase heme-binding subunit YedZ
MPPPDLIRRLFVGITSSTALWYASRATGVVALVLLTVVVLLGILVTLRGRLPGLPRFATASLHRSMSLLAVAFIAVHVITAIADPYVTIGIAAAVIPFTSAYKPLWLGLGAISLDIMIALIVTSLARARIGRPGAPCTGSPTPAGPPPCCTASGQAQTCRPAGCSR